MIPLPSAHHLQWSTREASKYGVVPQRFRHRIHEHPWFSDDRLTRLIDREPREGLRVFMSRIPCPHRPRGAARRAGDSQRTGPDRTLSFGGERRDATGRLIKSRSPADGTVALACGSIFSMTALFHEDQHLWNGVRRVRVGGVSGTRRTRSRRG